jgi:hypothetical protein
MKFLGPVWHTSEPWRHRCRLSVRAMVNMDDPDGLLIQLQDVKYCGGASVLGDVCS